MQTPPFRLRPLAFALGLSVFTLAGWAGDPPSRVARLGYMAGEVSFSPAGESDWVRATINRPMGTGDRLWADSGARVEIQVGAAMIRMNAGTGLSILNLDDHIAQLQLTQGVLNVRVRRLEPGQAVEVDTPNIAFTLRQPGEFRIEVDPDGDATTVFVRKGRGEVYGEGGAYAIDSRQSYRFSGASVREYRYVEAPRLDEFDRWSNDRDRRYDNSVSARYVSPDVIGYQDLDANGTWRVDATYGNVWFPNRVSAGWAPYRDGHWAWVDPWGWTWVDDAPWGFAVSHYGRWTNLGGSWGWVPGPARTRAYYAPALVAFVGGDGFQLTISSGSVGGIGWFPLGPREVYRPSYAVSRGYFENVNTSNTVINNTVINNYYTNTNVTNVVYANQQVPGAVIAVPASAFTQSQPVARVAVRVTPAMVAAAPVAAVAPVPPSERSVRGATVAGAAPPPRTFERPVVARTAPPAATAGFAAQQPQLTAKPGKPLEESARRELKPAPAAPAPAVRVIAPAQVAAPTAPPPRPGSAGKGDERKATPAPAAAKAPAASSPPSPPQRAAAPVASPPVAPAERAAAPVVSPPQRAAAPPVASPPAAPPQRAAAPVVSPPQRAAAPVATPQAQPAEQRGKAEPAQRAKPEPAPAAKRAEPGALVVAPSPLPQAEPAPKPQPRGQEVKPAAGKRDDKSKKESDEQKGEEEAPGRKR